MIAYAKTPAGTIAKVPKFKKESGNSRIFTAVSCAVKRPVINRAIKLIRMTSSEIIFEEGMVEALVFMLAFRVV